MAVLMSDAARDNGVLVISCEGEVLSDFLWTWSDFLLVQSKEAFGFDN